MHRRQFMAALAAMGAIGGIQVLDLARVGLAQAAAPTRGPDVVFVPTPN